MKLRALSSSKQQHIQIFPLVISCEQISRARLPSVPHLPLRPKQHTATTTNPKFIAMASHAQLKTGSTIPITELIIRDSSLEHALEVLRGKTTKELLEVRTLRISLTEANLLYWQGSLWTEASSVFDKDDLEEYARIYPAATPKSTNGTSPPCEEFRTLLRFIASSFDLGALVLEVDAGSAAWSLFEDKGAGAYGEDDVDDEWRFIYEFYLDIGRALIDVFGTTKLHKINVKTAIWDGMGPWLDAQICGKELETARAVTGVPRYHTATSRLQANTTEKN
ncbi:hypothetical protein BD289DRAFT_424531 [Coniella lustricola]|uniref:Uncharacterized protein n=1 Tax=Coniella lustricola TaxID=2025994 RepID=A0A2T3AI15_9PEZI|nr:hypothetical protein BD289DRAFT_424531 [Coniella lustricola]